MMMDWSSERSESHSARSAAAEIEFDLELDFDFDLSEVEPSLGILGNWHAGSINASLLVTAKW